MDATGVHLVRCWVTDDRLHTDEGGAGGFGAGSSSGRFDGFYVFTGLNGLDVPAISLIALGDVLVEGNVGVILNGDAVVIPEDDKVAQLLSACQGRGLSSHALLQITIRGDDINVVIEGRVASRGGSVEQSTLLARGHGHTNRGSQALAQRAGGDFYAVGVVNLRVAGSLRTPRAQRLEILHLEAEAAEEELDVLRQRRVPDGEDKAVASCPVNICWVVVEHALVERVGQRR